MSILKQLNLFIYWKKCEPCGNVNTSSDLSSCVVSLCIWREHISPNNSHLCRLGVGPLLGDLVGDDGHVSPLLVQDHSELPVELFDLQVDPVLTLKHLTDLLVIHRLIDVLN